MVRYLPGMKPALRSWRGKGGASHHKLGEDFIGPSPLRTMPLDQAHFTVRKFPLSNWESSNHKVFTRYTH